MKKWESMAKDRTRRARIREPKQESQADIVAREEWRWTDEHQRS